MAICSAISETVYNGRDNTIDIVLANNGEVIRDLSAVTRVTVKMDSTTTIDSAVVGSSVIWWTDQVTWRGAATDVLKLKLGNQSLTAGEYSGVEVVFYNATLTNGAQIETPFKFTVVD